MGDHSWMANLRTQVRGMEEIPEKKDYRARLVSQSNGSYLWRLLEFRIDKHGKGEWKIVESGDSPSREWAEKSVRKAYERATFVYTVEEFDLP